MSRVAVFDIAFSLGHPMMTSDTILHQVYDNSCHQLENLIVRFSIWFWFESEAASSGLGYNKMWYVGVGRQGSWYPDLVRGFQYQIGYAARNQE